MRADLLQIFKKKSKCARRNLCTWSTIILFILLELSVKDTVCLFFPHTNFLGDLGGDDIDVAMATVMGPNFVQQVVEALVTDADGRHHLWFKSLDDRLPSLKRCGEIDAAPYMPAAVKSS